MFINHEDLLIMHLSCLLVNVTNEHDFL